MLGLICFAGSVPARGGAQRSDIPPRARGAALRLNDAGYQYAAHLVAQGKIAFDGRGDWRVHRPTPVTEDAFIDSHGYADFGNWFLAVNDTFGVENRRRYAFPYGDFEVIRRSALLAARYRAREWGHNDILAAAGRLLAMIEAKEYA